MKCKEGSANWCFDKKNLLVLVDDNFKGIVGENVTQYKVGDYLEVDENGKIVHCYIVPKSEANQEISGLLYDISTPKRWVGCIYRNEPNTHIVRKLKPSEIIIRIGCLSGTVRPVSTNGIHIWVHLIGVDDKIIATIRISSLDAQTRELVESLLEAMRGEE